MKTFEYLEDKPFQTKFSFSERYMRVGITERGDAGLDFDKWTAAAIKKKVVFTIAITKAPSELVARYAELPENCIIHATITGWGATELETGVRASKHELAAYQYLCEKRGAQQVVLRIDPIIPTPAGLDRALRIAQHARGRLRISIFDAYPHAIARIEKKIPALALHLRNLYHSKLHLPEKERHDILQKFPGAEFCGEPGMPNTGCVSAADFTALSLPAPEVSLRSFQRASCACLQEKTELLSNRHPCAHGCLYCYWKS